MAVSNSVYKEIIVGGVTPVIVQRINCGGVLYIPTDSSLQYVRDDVAGSFNGDGFSVNDGDIFDDSSQTYARHLSIPDYISDIDLTNLFLAVRFIYFPDPDLTYTIDNLDEGVYNLVLLIGTNDTDVVEYNVLVQGNIYAPLDPIADFGLDTAGAYYINDIPVSNDGILSIEFSGGFYNLCQAIEVFKQ